MRLLLALVLFASMALLESSAQADGIKNSQTLLGGKLTRAGNSGRAQLSDEQLEDLCEKGYTNAYFLYSGAQTRTVNCRAGSISYRSQSMSDLAPILGDVKENIESGGKTFVHCNNGAHASGLVAALALRQFCGYSADAAMKYWSANLNGYALQPENMKAIRRRLDAFKPSSSLSISEGERAQICH